MKTIFFDLDDTLYFRRDAFFLAFDEFLGEKHQESKANANDRCRIRGDEVFLPMSGLELAASRPKIFTDCTKSTFIP